MSVFDLFDIVSARKAIKVINQLKSENPEAYQAWEVLSRVCLGQLPNYSAVAAPNGRLVMKSDILVRGLFNQPEFRSYILFDPFEKSTLFIYRPEYGQFKMVNGDTARLLNWINQQLTIGTAQLGDTEGIATKQLAYSLWINFSDILSDQLRALFENAIIGLLNFRDLFLPVLKATHIGRLGVDATGEFSGHQASPLRLGYKQTLAKQQLITSSEKLEQLANNMEHSLRELDYPYVWHPENRFFSVGILAGDGHEKTLGLYLSGDSKVGVQFQSDLDTEQVETILGSEFFLHTNSISSGRFFIDQNQAIVVYRYSLDFRGIEERVSASLIRNMITTSDADVHIRLKGLQMVTEGSSGQADIYSRLLRGEEPYGPGEPRDSSAAEVEEDDSVSPGSSVAPATTPEITIP